jgi:hypothetical protein
MIRYDLVCDKGHGFDGWFAGSDAFDTQARRGFVACAVCGSLKVERAIMAPSVRRTDRARRAEAPMIEADVPAPAPVPESAALLGEEGRRLREMLRELHAHVVANTEDVGTGFAEEARAIHEGEAEARSIRGRGAPDEIKALLEDGIAVLPLPPLPDAGH